MNKHLNLAKVSVTNITAQTDRNRSKENPLMTIKDVCSHPRAVKFSFVQSYQWSVLVTAQFENK